MPAISWDWVLVFAKGYINNHHGLEPQYDKVANWLRAKNLTVDVFTSMFFFYPSHLLNALYLEKCPNRVRELAIAGKYHGRINHAVAMVSIFQKKRDKIIK